MNVTFLSFSISLPKFLGTLIGLATLYVILMPTPVGTFLKNEIENVMAASDAYVREATAKADAAERAGRDDKAQSSSAVTEHEMAFSASSDAAVASSDPPLGNPEATPTVIPVPIPTSIPGGSNADSESGLFAPPEPSASCWHKWKVDGDVRLILTREATDKLEIVRAAVVTLAGVRQVYTTVPGDSCFQLTVEPDGTVPPATMRDDIQRTVFAQLAPYGAGLGPQYEGAIPPGWTLPYGGLAR